MNKAELHPFANESESLQIGELTIENRTDRVSIYGSLDLTLDKPGLEQARRLKTILDSIMTELEKAELPDKVAVIEPDTVRNPFA
jgi:hypothetical protein